MPAGCALRKFFYLKRKLHILRGEEEAKIFFINLGRTRADTTSGQTQQTLTEREITTDQFKADGGVNIIPVFTKKVERPERQVPAVRGVRPGIERGKMRRENFHQTARSSDPMDLLHDLQDVFDMFNNLGHDDAVETVVLERPGELIDIMNHVNPGKPDPVNTYRPGLFI